jgi:hypothetical protein
MHKTLDNEMTPVSPFLPLENKPAVRSQEGHNLCDTDATAYRRKHESLINMTQWRQRKAVSDRINAAQRYRHDV